MLKTSKMNFASYHTNVDNSPTGINYYIAKEMGLHQIKVIPNTSIVTGKLGFSYRAKVFANTLRVQFDLERILYTSDDLVRNVAFCAGAGFEILKENQNKLNGVDLWVTGDIK
jgi:putative NIF3 family GTP cyclohydrolase 1 type 2